MTAGPLISYYGDDFTGSTDVMEALSSNGVETVLFTRLPTDAERAAFAGCRAVGLAGTSRSQSPQWMDETLPGHFRWLKALRARHCHYKVCSTFDSAPQQGSIGRAMEIGLDVFDQAMTGIVVGAPQLRRYTVFGHLFAAYRDEIHRIDRHPVMSRHPATPMHESDLRRHLGAQTGMAMGLVGGIGATQDEAARALASFRREGMRACILDVHDAASQLMAGRLLEESALGPFVVGSSGVEYALVAHWRASGRLDGGAVSHPALARQERIAVVSGSCSPTTERQIRAAAEAGFETIDVDYAALAGLGDGAAAFDKALARAMAALQAGRSPIVHTALGPDTARTMEGASNDAVGRALGRLLRSITERAGLRRVVVAGGDTSSHALSELGIFALTLRHPIPQSPGSPVCTAHREADAGSLQITLKGGQIGGDDYFVRLRDGTIA
jgi:3-oxoisoapionate kinase